MAVRRLAADRAYRSTRYRTVNARQHRAGPRGAACSNRRHRRGLLEIYVRPLRQVPLVVFTGLGLPADLQRSHPDLALILNPSRARFNLSGATRLPVRPDRYFLKTKLPRAMLPHRATHRTRIGLRVPPAARRRSVPQRPSRFRRAVVSVYPQRASPSKSAPNTISA